LQAQVQIAISIKALHDALSDFAEDPRKTLPTRKTGGFQMVEALLTG
jgi:hypothetical protein